MVYTVCAIDLFFPSISFPSFICFGDNGLWRIIVRKKSECALVSSRSGRYRTYTRTRDGTGHLPRKCRRSLDGALGLFSIFIYELVLFPIYGIEEWGNG